MYNLGGIIGSGAILDPSIEYTFTLDSGSFFTVSSTQDIQDMLIAKMAPFASVYTVDCPMFSQRIILTLKPKRQYTLEQIFLFLQSALSNLNFYNVTLVRVDSGTVSSAPGGIQQLITSTAGAASEVVSGTIAAVIEPIKTPLYIGLGVLALIYIMPLLKDRKAGN